MRKEDLIKKIKAIILEKNLEIDINEHTVLGDAMTSIEIIEFVAEIEEYFDVFFDDEELEIFNKSIDEIVTFLLSKELKEF